MIRCAIFLLTRAPHLTLISFGVAMVVRACNGGLHG